MFNGDGRFPSGVFSSRENAEAWIAKHSLSGCLTMYPLDEGAYDWAIREGYWTPRREDQKTPEFISGFACGRVHFHYRDGRGADE